MSEETVATDQGVTGEGATGEVINGGELQDGVVVGGGETDAGAETAKAQPSARDLIYATAEARRRQELKEEGVQFEETGSLPHDGAGDKADDKLEDQKPKKELFDIKVDGQTSQVSADEINRRLGTSGDVDDSKVREFQKNVAADRRLEEAAAIRRQNEARAAELAQREAALAVMRATPAGEVPAEINGDLVTTLTDAILTEDHEGAKKALQQIVSAARGPATAAVQPITQEQLDAAARNALAAQEYERNLANGRKTLQDKFGHLLGDESLVAAINTKAAHIFEMDRSKSPGDILVEAATEVNENILRIAGVSSTPGSDRLARKREASGHAVSPKAGGAVGTRTTEKAEQPKSTQQIVAEMVAARNSGLSGRAA